MKLYKRIKEQLNLEKQLGEVVYRTEHNDIEEILRAKNKPYRTYQDIAYNIKALAKDDVKEHILNELQDAIKIGEITVSTDLRRLCLIYDLWFNAQGDNV